MSTLKVISPPEEVPALADNWPIALKPEPVASSTTEPKLAPVAVVTDKGATYTVSPTSEFELASATVA